jgi:DNA-directed RNA polymerase specialized sigma24 family protein
MSRLGRNARKANHCTLCRLHRLGHLRDRTGGDARQSDLRHAAGEKLQDDHSRAGLTWIPGSLGGAPRSAGHGPVDISQVKIDAANRRVAALRAVGPAARFLLENIVVEDMTLAQVARIMGVKDNAVLPALRVALDALAAHYGFVFVAPAPGGGRAADPIHPFQQFD